MRDPPFPPQGPSRCVGVGGKARASSRLGLAAHVNLGSRLPSLRVSPQQQNEGLG